MSDADEIGGYDPTTPFKPMPVPKNRKLNTRAAGGPSTSKPALKGAASKQKAPRDSPELIEDDGDESAGAVHVVEQGRQTPPAAKSKSKGAHAPVANGQVTSKGKGKGKALVEPQINGSRDGTPVVIEESDEVPTPPIPAHTGKTMKKQAALPPPRKEEVLSHRTLARMERQLQQVTGQRDQLADQIKELMSIRQTEPEEELQIQAARYESKAKAQDELINQLTSQLARVDPMIKVGRTSTLHFLTREEANEEKRVVEGEVHRIKDIVREKDEVIAQKNQDIRELQQKEKDLRIELNAEIERNKLLLARPPRDPSSALRGRGAHDGVSNDPKNGATVRLYEDMTNFLVTNIKFEKGGYLDLEDWTYFCVFTTEKHTSLTFSLTLTWTPKPDAVLPIASKDQLVATVRYKPLELDKETAEYVQRLDYLGDSFTFTRDQLDVFLKTLNDQLAGAQDEEPADEVQMDES